MSHPAPSEPVRQLRRTPSELHFSSVNVQGDRAGPNLHAGGRGFESQTPSSPPTVPTCLTRTFALLRGPRRARRHIYGTSAAVCRRPRRYRMQPFAVDQLQLRCRCGRPIWLGQSRQSLRNSLVPLGGGVLIDERRPGASVAHATRQFLETGAGRGGERVAAKPEVMEPE